jgi:hypothetical protein
MRAKCLHAPGSTLWHIACDFIDQIVIAKAFVKD